MKIDFFLPQYYLIVLWLKNLAKFLTKYLTPSDALWDARKKGNCYLPCLKSYFSTTNKKKNVKFEEHNTNLLTSNNFWHKIMNLNHYWKSREGMPEKRGLPFLLAWEITFVGPRILPSLYVICHIHVSSYVAGWFSPLALRSLKLLQK